MLRAAHALAPSAKSDAPRIQRKCACGRSGDAESCANCAEKDVQRKLALGADNDPLEIEADRVAHQVLSSGIAAGLSRVPVRVQRFAAAHSGQGREAPPGVDHVLSGAGRPLDGALRADMERRFGHDFSEVRVHQGAEAGRSARSLNAQAYTAGSHIVFGAGRFAPTTAAGRHLLAHELTHVVQQGAPGTAALVQRQIESDEDGEPELEAGDDREVVAQSEPQSEDADRQEMSTPAAKGNTPKPKKPKNPCTKTILSEGSCQHLVDKSKYVCCDDEKGLKTDKRTTDIDGVDCPNQKFTPIFTCDSKCKKAVEKGCDDNDNWMALPGRQFKRSKCGDIWTICANGKQTMGYVRDKSETKNSFEVSPGIQAQLRVRGSFLGAVYKPGAKQSVIDADKCCKAP